MRSAPPHYSSPKLVHSSHQHHPPISLYGRTRYFFFLLNQGSRSPSSGLRMGKGEGLIIHAAIARAPVDCACPSSFSGGRSSYPKEEKEKKETVRLASFRLRWHSIFCWYRNLISSLLLPPTHVRRDKCLPGWSGRRGGGEIEKEPKTHLIEYHSDCKTTTRAYSNFLAIAHVTETYLKLVSARARVCI